MAVRLMLKGETSLVTSDWDRAFHREEDAPEVRSSEEAEEKLFLCYCFLNDPGN